MNGWEMQAIGNVVSRAQMWNPLREAKDEVFDYIDLSSVDQNYKRILGVREIACGDAPSRARQLVIKGDVLVSTVRPNLNCVTRVPEELDGATASTGFCVLRPLNQTIHGAYLFQWVKSSMFINDMVNKATGASYPAVSDRIIYESRIPLPPLEAQTRIAHLLGKVEALITQRKENLQQLDELLKSVFLEMFGDPVSNEKGWDKKTAIDYANCIVPGRDKPRGFNGDVPWVTTNDLQNLGHTFTSKQGIGLSDDEIEEVRARVIPAGSIIITCVGDLGVASICGKDMVVNQQLHSFQVKEGMNNIFFMYAISFHKNYMYRNASTTTVPYMNKTICNRIPMIAPPTDLQNQFATIFDKIEYIKSHYQYSLNQFENLYGVLSQKAFNGELDLSSVLLPATADLSDSDQIHIDKLDDLKPKNKAGSAKSTDNIGKPAPFTNKDFEEFLSAHKNEVLTATALWQELKQVNFENQPPNFESFKSLVMDYLDEGKWLEQVYAEVPVYDDVDDSKVEKLKEKKVALRVRDDS